MLVDLREHGRSRRAPPPHSVAAAAEDLDAVVGALPGPASVRAVIGHSFGGKVALAFRSRAGQILDQTWVMDASPSAREEDVAPPASVERVLELLESMPARFSHRDEFVSEVKRQGFSEMLGAWLAMNLVPAGGGVELALDLGAIRSLLSDHMARDAWPEAEDEGAPGELHFVVGERSDALSAGDRERLASLARAMPGRAFVHRVDAGHWLHVEALDDVVALLSSSLFGP